LEYRAQILNTGTVKPLFYNDDDPQARLWGARLYPFGLSFAARRLDDPPPPWLPPWDKYEYAGVRDIGRRVDDSRSSYEPTSFRLWNNYQVLKAEAAFDRGDGRTGLAYLRATAPLAARDGLVAWSAASIYHRHGYYRDALGLYLSAASAIESYRFDDKYHRYEYADLLNRVGQVYYALGDRRQARRYFDSSLEIAPELPSYDDYASAFVPVPPG
jgi:tetratricopeptide (TPR) repeat protein